MSMAKSAQDDLVERMPGDDTFLSAAERRAYLDKVALAKAPNDGGAMGSAEAARRAVIAKLSKPIEITPQMRQGLLTKLRIAADNGETELMLSRFPVESCRDRGRAINHNEPDWPQTLTGVPALHFWFWQKSLQPTGYGDRRLAGRHAGRGRLLSPLRPARPGLTARRHV
jgi:hypothetical protein